MTSNDLDDILRNTYKINNWRRILHHLFPKSSFLSRLLSKELLTQAQQEIAKDISVLGNVELADKSLIAFYVVELGEESSIARNRVGLRSLISSDVVPGYLDGILAVYHSKSSPEWRMSFISKSASLDEEGMLVKQETQPRRYTYVFGPDESCKTAIERLSILLDQVSEGIEIKHLLQAFSVEKISKEFFEQYRHHFEALTSYLEQTPVYRRKFEATVADQNDHDEFVKLTNRAISNFVKKFMGRLVFLYFLQKKGWMGATTEEWDDGLRDFVRLLFNECDSPETFYEQVLTKLFFESLNKADRPGFDFLIHGRSPFADGIVRKVPYLNGGLFDKDISESTEINFRPTDLQAVFDFFDSYNFTIDENLPADQDIGVDPEMLGMIFENLLEDNKDKGTFYTPKEVVHFMCRESLSLYLQRKLGDQLSKGQLRQIDRFLKGERSHIPELIIRNADAIYQALDEVRICDPAIGSGAFPMGLVLELFDLKRKLSGLRSRPRNFNFHEEKLRIIQANIYGVDLDKGAVDIARLRFWLSLIVDEEKPSPLPNLDYKIMQGDSLVENFEGIPLDNVLNSRDTPVILESGHQMNMFGAQQMTQQAGIDLLESEKTGLKILVSKYFDPTTLDKEGVQKRIEGIIHDHIDYNFELKQKAISQLIGEEQKKLALISEKDEGSKAQKEKRIKAREKQQAKLSFLDQEERELQQKKDRLNSLQHKDEKPYFLWHLYFNDILNGQSDGGFDIVIGNPPYGIKVPDILQEEYKLGSKDSYGVFMSMALHKLLRPQGVLCFIVSDTWLTIKTHLKLRDQLLAHRLQKVIRLHQDCFKATVNSCIFTLIKNAEGGRQDNSQLLAADLTNVSTRVEVPLFRELIFNLETFAGSTSPKYGVYTYSSSLIQTNSLHPIFVASSKLFTLLSDVDPAHVKTVSLNSQEESGSISVKLLTFNGNNLELCKFSDIADVKQGLATGDNDYYLYQESSARGTYKDISEYSKYLLTAEDLETIRMNQDLRQKVIEKGICKVQDEADFELDRYFNGRFIVPYDKGGESDTSEGWLPNYFVPTNYFIDWSSEARARLSTYKIADRIRDKNESKAIKASYHTTNAAVIRSPDKYFMSGITFSRTGMYSPSFRLNSMSVFDTEGSTIFISSFDVSTVLGVLSSKLVRYLLKNYIGHSIHTQVDELKLLSFPFIREDKLIKGLVQNVMARQRVDVRYDYQSNEQKEIDKSVYKLYQLDDDDTQEVERWFARRYPKLASYAEIKPDNAERYVIEGELTIEANQILHQIAHGEKKHLEFKSTLLYDIKQDRESNEVKHSVLKTLAGFANSEGGNLLIGVSDDGQLFGLKQDYILLDVTDKSSANQHDAFRQRLDALIEAAFGNAFFALIDATITLIGTEEVCVLSVQGSQTPVELRETGKANRFYIRRLSSTKELTEREKEIYIRSRWR